MSRKLSLAVAGVIGLVVSAGLVATGEGGCGGAPEHLLVAPSDSGSDIGLSDGSLDGSAEAEAGPQCSPDFKVPDGVPSGWMRLPCAPTTCDIFIAPDAAHMRRASPWASAPGGWLELVDDWADNGHRVLDARGASAGGTRYIGYQRDLGNMPGADGPREVQIVRLPDNVVTFDAIMPYEVKDGVCFMQLDAIAPEVALLYSYVQLSDPTKSERLVHTVPTGGGTPQLSFDHVDSYYPLESQVTSSLWAATYGRRELAWHGPGLANTMQIAWTAPNGRLLDSMQAIGGTIFFSSLNQPGSDIVVWDVDGGSRTLIGYPSPTAGAACCLRSDGQTMVWFQGQGLDAKKGTYADVRLMASPHATHAADVKPRTLRPAFQDYVDTGGGVIGG